MSMRLSILLGILLSVVILANSFSNIPKASAQTALDSFTTYVTPNGSSTIKFSPKWNILPINNMSASTTSTTCDMTITNPILSTMPTNINFGLSNLSSCEGYLYMYNSEHFYAIVDYYYGGNKVSIRHYYYNSSNNTWNYTTIANDLVTSSHFSLNYIAGVYIVEPNYNKLYLFSNLYKETYVIENNTITTLTKSFIYFPAVNKYIGIQNYYAYITDSNFNNLFTIVGNGTEGLNIYNLIQIAPDKAYISTDNFGDFIVDLTNNIKIDNSYNNLSFGTYNYLINELTSSFTTGYIFAKDTINYRSMTKNSVIFNSSKLPYALLYTAENTPYSFTNLSISQNKVNYAFPTFTSSNRISYSFGVIDSSSFSSTYYNYTLSWSKVNSTTIRVTLSNSVFGFPTTIDFVTSNLGTLSPTNVYFMINATVWDASGNDAVLFYYNPNLNSFNYSYANSSGSNYVQVATYSTAPTLMSLATLPNNLVFYHTNQNYILINMNNNTMSTSYTSFAFEVWYTSSYIYLVTSNRLMILQPTTTPSLTTKLDTYIPTNFTINNIIEKSSTEAYIFTSVCIYKFNGSSLTFVKQYALDSYFTNTNMTESLFSGKYVYMSKNMFLNYNAMPATQRLIEISSTRQATTVTQSFTNQTLNLINPLYVNIETTINAFDFYNVNLLPKFNEQNYIFIYRNSNFTNTTNPSTTLFPIWQQASVGVSLNNNHNIIYYNAINVGINGTNDYIIPTTNIFGSMNGSITSNSAQLLLDSADRYKNFITVNSNADNNALKVNALLSLNGKYYSLYISPIPVYIKDLGSKYMLYKENYMPLFLDKTQDQLLALDALTSNIKYAFPYDSTMSYYFTYHPAGTNTNLEKRDYNNNIISTYVSGNPQNHSIFNNLIIFTDIDKVFNLTTEEIYTVEAGNFNYILKGNKYYKYATITAYYLDDNLQYSFNNNIPIEVNNTNRSSNTKQFVVIHNTASIVNMLNNTTVNVTDNIVELDKGTLYKITRDSYQTYLKPTEDFISTTPPKVTAITPQSGIAGNVIYYLEIKHKDLPLYYPATPTTRGNSSTTLLENSLYTYKINLYSDDTAGNPTPQFPLGCSGLFVDNNTTNINIYCSESVTLKAESYVVNIIKDNVYPNRIISIIEQIQDLNNNGYTDELSRYRPFEIRVQDLNGVILYTNTITDNTTPLNQVVDVGTANENTNKLVFLLIGDPSSNNRTFLRYEWFLTNQSNIIKDILLGLQNYYGLNIVFFIVVLLAGLYNRSNQGIITVIIIALILFFSSIGLITLTPMFIAVIVLIAVAYLIYTKSIGWG